MENELCQYQVFLFEGLGYLSMIFDMHLYFISIWPFRLCCCYKIHKLLLLRNNQ